MKKKIIFISIFLSITLLINYCYKKNHYFTPQIMHPVNSKKNIDCITIQPLLANKKIKQELYLMQKNEWKVNSFLELLEQDKSAYNQLPLTFVVFYNNSPIGSCSIEEQNDLETTLSPWASHLYIKPEYRGKKIARRLIWKILEKAQELGYSEIFYVTNNPTNISIYKHLGGEIVKTTFTQGCEYTIMKRDLNNIDY